MRLERAALRDKPPCAALLTFDVLFSPGFKLIPVSIARTFRTSRKADPAFRSREAVKPISIVCLVSDGELQTKEGEMGEQRFLTLDEWSAECLCEPSCILRAVKLGVMPRPVTVDGKQLWSRATLDAWIDSGHPRQDAAGMDAD